MAVESSAAEADRYIAWAEAEARNIPGLGQVEARPVDVVGVIGAGTMGTGIAVSLLLAGLRVVLVECDAAVLGSAQASIGKIIEGYVATGRTGSEAGRAALEALTGTTDIKTLTCADLIIEAVYESMDIKQAIFAQLDEIAKPNAILATNTSYLDVAQIASVTSRPADVLGLHFFSPAHIMKLLEIVSTNRTAVDVLATAIALATRLAKTPVVAKNAFGFIGNRMLRARRNEADAIILEGVTPERVDRIVEAFGFRMGPFRMADLAGLDLGWTANTSTGATVRERLCEAGRRGQKSGAGFYDYDEQRRPRVSGEALAIIDGFAHDQGVRPRAWSDDAILDRMLLPMIDEGARLLAEGIALRPSDIDVVWLNGYGWPRHTGGPMRYVQQLGASELRGRFAAIGREPSDALLKLCKSIPEEGQSLT